MTNPYEPPRHEGRAVSRFLHLQLVIALTWAAQLAFGIATNGSHAYDALCAFNMCVWFACWYADVLRQAK